MALITGILVQMITGKMSGAGTDGRVFLGLGGREFRLDSATDDYERGSWLEYILGRAPLEPDLPAPQVRVNNKERNDPRWGFPLDTAYLNRTPAYIRFEPEGSSPDWHLLSAFALVYTGESQFLGAFYTPLDFGLWLGNGYGKIVYLTEEWRQEPDRLLAIGRELASRASEADASP